MDLFFFNKKGGEPADRKRRGQDQKEIAKKGRHLCSGMNLKCEVSRRGRVALFRREGTGGGGHCQRGGRKSGKRKRMGGTPLFGAVKEGRNFCGERLKGKGLSPPGRVRDSEVVGQVFERRGITITKGRSMQRLDDKNAMEEGGELLRKTFADKKGPGKILKI